MKKMFVTLFLLAVIAGSCNPARETYAPLAIEIQQGDDMSKAVDFGNLPRLVNLSSISVSAWFYRTADTVTFADAIASVAADYAGWIFATTPNREITYYQKATPGNAGEWSSPDNAYSLNGWVNVIVTRNNSAAANKPVIYVNGSSVVVTEDVAQIGANPDETANHFLIGNTNTIFVPLTIPFHGKLFDVRVYRNYILTASDATAIFNGGTPSASAGPLTYDKETQTGLVFQSFAVRTDKLADYTDQNINGLKLFDAQFRAVGTVIGDVTARAAP